MTKFMGIRNKIRWYSTIYDYDIETGEILHNTKEYYKITSHKKIIINHETARTITRTNGWRKRPHQTTIW
jgi:hypothetical protein